MSDSRSCSSACAFCALRIALSRSTCAVASFVSVVVLASTCTFCRSSSCPIFCLKRLSSLSRCASACFVTESSFASASLKA